MKRILLFGLLAGLLTNGTGCGLFQAVFCYRPCVIRGDCDGYRSDGCGDCGPVAAYGRPVRGPVYGPRRAMMADCGDGCGDGCGDPWRDLVRRRLLWTLLASRTVELSLRLIHAELLVGRLLRRALLG